MIFCLYTDYGALNSKPVFEAFAKSITDAGHTVTYNEPYRVIVSLRRFYFYAFN